MDTTAAEWRSHDDVNIYAYNLGMRDAVTQRVSHAKRTLSSDALTYYNAGFHDGLAELEDRE